MEGAGCWLLRPCCRGCRHLLLRSCRSASRVSLSIASYPLHPPHPTAVGASNLGHVILYSILNQQEGLLCDRAYFPGTDMHVGGRSYMRVVCAVSQDVHEDDVVVQARADPRRGRCRRLQPCGYVRLTGICVTVHAVVERMCMMRKCRTCGPLQLSHCLPWSFPDTTQGLHSAGPSPVHPRPPPLLPPNRSPCLRGTAAACLASSPAGR